MPPGPKSSSSSSSSFDLRSETMGFGCPLHSVPWPSTYPPTSYQAIEFPPCWDTGVPGMWVICQGNPTPPPLLPPLLCVCVSAGKHVYALGAFSRNLSGYVASPGGPRQVSVNGCVSSAHASTRTVEAGASWSRQFEPSISPMWRACHPTPCSICASPHSPKHLYRHSIQWRLYTAYDSGSWTCWHLHCKAHHALKTHSDRIALTVALAVCVHTAKHTRHESPAVCVGVALLLGPQL